MSDRILLVEDNPKLAKFIESELGFEGYHVTVAPNGLDRYQRTPSESESTSAPNSTKKQDKL
jgi:DNA-binding response OmpR family regulator